MFIFQQVKLINLLNITKKLDLPKLTHISKDVFQSTGRKENDNIVD